MKGEVGEILKREEEIREKRIDHLIWRVLKSKIPFFIKEIQDFNYLYLRFFSKKNEKEEIPF